MLDHIVEPRGAVEEVIVARKKAGGTQDVGISRLQLITGEHFLNHAIIAFAGIQRIHDPITPVPQMLLAEAKLFAKAIPVAVAPDVHEVPAPALAMLRRGKEPVDDAPARDRRVLCNQSVLLFQRRGQTRQIERHAPQPER